jgi:hypothetical protein
MNDFEDRLRRTPLRLPPSEWRDEVLLAASASRNWRAEVWPSLSAWAALAAVWLFLLAIEGVTAPPDGGQERRPSVAIEPPSSDSLLAYHAALNSTNTRNHPH